MKCPINLEKNHQYCSAGVCDTCQVARRAEVLVTSDPHIGLSHVQLELSTKQIVDRLQVAIAVSGSKLIIGGPGDVPPLFGGIRPGELFVLVAGGEGKSVLRDDLLASIAAREATDIEVVEPETPKVRAERLRRNVLGKKGRW